VTSDQRINSRRKLNRTLNQKSLTIFNAITKTKTKETFHTTTVHISGAEIIDSKDLRITLENQMITQKLQQQVSWYQKSKQVCSRPSS
jgi:ABC-type oligopeptide transport system substrate-binding subunit